MSHAASHDQHDHHHALPPFWKRMFTTSNHKDIGTMYLVFALIMLLCGGSAAMVVRAELMYPGLQLLQPDFFNQMSVDRIMQAATPEMPFAVAYFDDEDSALAWLLASD